MRPDAPARCGMNAPPSERDRFGLVAHTIFCSKLLVVSGRVEKARFPALPGCSFAKM